MRTEEAVEIDGVDERSRGGAQEPHHAASREDQPPKRAIVASSSRKVRGLVSAESKVEPPLALKQKII